MIVQCLGGFAELRALMGDLKGMRVAKLSKMHLLEHLAQALAGKGQNLP